MIATAGVAVLMAGYRVEVQGNHGLGLVPACAFLAAGLLARDAHAAWRAAGTGPGILQIYILAPVCGAAVVVLADVVFIAFADVTSLALAIQVFPDLWSRLGTPDIIKMTSLTAIAMTLSIGPALLIAMTCRRIFWRIALAPPTRQDVKPDPEPLPAAVPVGPIG